MSKTSTQGSAEPLPKALGEAFIEELITELGCARISKDQAVMVFAIDRLLSALASREIALIPSQHGFDGQPIVTNYAARCAICDGVVKKGETALWAKGVGTAHLTCSRGRA